MYTVLLCSLLALLFTYLESKHILRDGMKIGFILVTLLGVIHYDYGNDYLNYYDIYYRITDTPFDWYDLISGDIYKEPGWALINYAFSYIGGFFMMVAALNVLQNCFVYLFIKQNVNVKWWPIAVFIYLFSTNYYLLNFSMMRQGLAVCGFLAIWPYIKDRQWLKSLILLWLLSLVHSSALVLIPFAFWGFLPVKRGLMITCVFSALFLFLWFSSEYINVIFEELTMLADFEEYSDAYSDDGGYESIGLGFIINLIPFIISLKYIATDKSNDYTSRQLVLLASVGAMILPFGRIIHLVSRIGIYFGIFTLASIPIAYGSIKNRIIRWGLISIFILMTLYNYWLFFNEGAFASSYKEFKSIFSLL